MTKKDTRPYLQIHSHTRRGSLRDCIASVEDMCKISAQNNMSWTCTDHGSVGALLENYNLAKKHGTKFVPGVELYVNGKRDRMFVVRERLAALKKEGKKTQISKEENENRLKEIRQLSYEFEELKKPRHLLVVAKNEFGFYNLLQLVNEGYLKGFYNKPTNTYKELFDLPKKNGDRGLIVTSSCIASDSSQFILNNKKDNASDWLEMMKEEFCSDFYAEVQPNKMEEQRIVNTELIQLANKLKIPLVVGADSHYISMKHSKLHELFLLMQGKQKVSDIGKKQWRITYETKKGEVLKKKVEKDGEFFGESIKTLKIGDSPKNNEIKKIEEVNKVWMIEDAELSFKTEADMRNILKQREELKDIEDLLISNNKDLYEKIENIEIDSSIKLPRFENDDETLKKLCAKGLIRIKKSKDLEYIQRLKYELDIIKRGGLASYFLILEDLVSHSIKIGIPVGPSRGSGGSALVNYLLGITRLDPIEWGKKTAGMFDFARFLNPERVSKKDVISIETDEGFKEVDINEEIKIKRDNKVIIVKAVEIKIGDEIE